MPALMVVGCTSHAGKSLITAAICRLLRRQGWRVAPFKGQNMALNAYVTASGGEIGYAQAFQAWAAGVEPTIEMNPILLKPQGDMTSQVVLNGRAVGRTTAEHYYQDYFEVGWEAICEALDRLQAEYDWIVCEGAGSPAEINLKHRDLTNLRVAKHLQAPTLLLVDIDRGGSFAHLIGTLELLDPEEQSLIRGFVFNKFRGRRELLQSGLDWLEERTGIPVLGVIPWIDRAFPSEDSLDLMERRRRKTQAEVTIAVIRLPRIANFTDFDPLESEPSVQVRYVGLHDELGYPDAVILPGSKTTISDLLDLQRSGLAQAIRDYAAAGGTVLGICGGFQMMGQQIIDTEGNEGTAGQFEGLQLLPTQTWFTAEKTLRQRQTTARSPQAGLPITGYEIHQGQTRLNSDNDEFQPIFDDPKLGLCDRSGNLWGTYLHGVFDNGAWRRAWLNSLRHRRGLKALPTSIGHYQAQRDDLIDALADAVEPHLNLSPLLTSP